MTNRELRREENMIEIECTKHYLSLFDFLGKAAGAELGAKVWKAALWGNVPTSSRWVSNKAYTGKVVLYPLDFLEDYFKVNPAY